MSDAVDDLMGAGDAKGWQEAWLNAKQSGATKDKEFWRKYNRANGRGGLVVTGIMEVDAALQEFENATRKRLIVAATKKINKKIKQDAVTMAPRDTGALAKAIKVTALRKRQQKFKNRGKAKQIGSSVTVGEKLFVGQEFYGGFLEMGTKERVTKAGESRGKIEYPRFAFLRPALWKNEEYVRSSFVHAVRDAISDAARRAQNKIIKSLLPGAKAVAE